MENQVSTIVCPNCGASTSNRHNCEYCGSLLVRFITKDIPLDDYQKNTFVYDGIESALKTNLLLQETSGNDKICITDVFSDNGELDIKFVPSADATFGLDTPYNPFENASKPSLAVRVPFQVNSPNLEFAFEERKALAAFKQMDIFPLFTEVGSQYNMTYYIDFGKDYESASRMFTNIMKKVYNCTEKTTLIFNSSTIDKKNYKVQVDDSGTSSKRKVIIMAIIVIILYILHLVLNNTIIL